MTIEQKKKETAWRFFLASISSVTRRFVALLRMSWVLTRYILCVEWTYSQMRFWNQHTLSKQVLGYSKVQGLANG